VYFLFLFVLGVTIRNTGLSNSNPALEFFPALPPSLSFQILFPQWETWLLYALVLGLFHIVPFALLTVTSLEDGFVAVGSHALWFLDGFGQKIGGWEESEVKVTEG
jgi:hypothetical protein